MINKNVISSIFTFSCPLKHRIHPSRHVIDLSTLSVVYTVIIYRYNVKQRHLKRKTQFPRVFFHIMWITRFDASNKLYRYICNVNNDDFSSLKDWYPNSIFSAFFSSSSNPFPIDWTSVLLYYYLRIEMNRGVSFMRIFHRYFFLWVCYFIS